MELTPDGRVLIDENCIATVLSSSVQFLKMGGGAYRARVVQQLGEHLIIADLLDRECAAIRLPRSGSSRHTMFASSLRRARLPLHSLVIQTHHGIAECQCPDQQMHAIKLAIMKFKRTVDALQRAAPRGHIPGLSALCVSTHAIVRRMRNPCHSKKKWIADQAKWWGHIKAVPAKHGCRKRRSSNCSCASAPTRTLT